MQKMIAVATMKKTSQKSVDIIAMIVQRMRGTDRARVTRPAQRG
jgi:hypothetical protein